MGSTCLLYLLIVVFVILLVSLYTRKGRKTPKPSLRPHHVYCFQAVLYFKTLQFTRKQEANDNFCLGIVDDIKLILSGRRNTLFNHQANMQVLNEFSNRGINRPEISQQKRT
jgi:hypothetical protein